MLLRAWLALFRAEFLDWLRPSRRRHPNAPAFFTEEILPGWQAQGWSLDANEYLRLGGHPLGRGDVITYSGRLKFLPPVGVDELPAALVEEVSRLASREFESRRPAGYEVETATVGGPRRVQFGWATTDAYCWEIHFYFRFAEALK